MVICMEERTNQELIQELNRLTKAQARIKRRTTFLLSIIAMLVLITGTLAWFTLSNFASVHDMTLKISTAPELYLDIENRGTDVTLWKKTLTNDMINTYLASVNAPRIDQQLLDPSTSSDGITLKTQSGTIREANKNTYLEFKVWFIATKEMWVHLSGQNVLVNNESATTQVTTTETGSKADIVRALRISYEDPGTSSAIWEPNQGGAVAGQSTFDVSQTFSNSTRLFHLNQLEPKQITIRIWAEGEDPECDNDVQSAQVTVQMLFGGTGEDNTSAE